MWITSLLGRNLFMTFNLMSKGVGMCMLPLTSMLKWNALRVITNIMQNSMVCRMLRKVSFSLISLLFFNFS
nr:hypothetical protein Iba_scaffold12155CG0080 [Ipomoea batatas]